MSCLAPYGSLRFQSAKGTALRFVTFLVVLVVFLVLDKNFTHFAEAHISFAELSVSHSGWIVDYGIIIITLAATIFISMRYYVKAFRKEHNRTENLVSKPGLYKQRGKTLKTLQETKMEMVQSEKMVALVKLAAWIAHEINNPIGALQSTAGISAQYLPCCRYNGFVH